MQSAAASPPTAAAMALLPDAATFYSWVTATWLFTASVVVAIVRCRTRGRGLRVEDVFTGFRAPLLLVAALLSQVSFRLYTIRVSIPERQRRGKEAVGVNAAMERFLSDEAYVWPLGVCMFGLVAILISRAYDAARKMRRRAPPTPQRAVSGQRPGGCRETVAELVLFLFCVWICVYCFPVMVRGYMAATANGSGATAA